MEHEHFFTIIAIIIAFLASSGAGYFFVRYGTRLKLQESASDRHEKDLAELRALDVKTRLSGVEEAVKEIKASLHTLPAIDQKLDYLVKSVDKMIPRAEVELRFELQDQKIEALKDFPEKTY